MHVVFVHQTFPAQFGRTAEALVRLGHECTFVSNGEPGTVVGIQKIQYRPVGEVSEETHPLARPFDFQMRSAAGIYRALLPLRDVLTPDLIVGHAALGPVLLLREVFPNVPLVSYFEYFYHPRGQHLDFRPEFPPSESVRLRTRLANAAQLLSLEYSAAGYSPTAYQQGLYPEAYRPKIKVIHEGVDDQFWRREETPEREVAGRRFGPETRIVTYVTRGFEAARGFDVFMRVAKRIYTARDDVVFLVVGEDRIIYGADAEHIGGNSFKEYVLRQDDYDLNRVLFLGPLPPIEVQRVYNLSDLHFYLTVPYALSWSLLEAMACGCAVLGSDTEPVREVVRDGENGLLRPFADEAALASAALGVLEDPAAYRHLGAAAARTVRERYSVEGNTPRLLAFFEDVIAARTRR